METSSVQNNSASGWIPEVARSVGESVWAKISSMIWSPAPPAKKSSSESFVLIGRVDDLSASVCLAPEEENGENGLVSRLAPQDKRSGMYAGEGYKGPKVNAQFVRDAERAVDNRLIYINGKPCSAKTPEDLAALTKQIFEACKGSQKLFDEVTEILNQRIQIDLRNKIQERAKKALDIAEGWNPVVMEGDFDCLEIHYDTKKPAEVIVKARGTIRYMMNELLDVQPIYATRFIAEAVHNLKDPSTVYKVVFRGPEESKT